MGLFPFLLGGTGFILIGAHEAHLHAKPISSSPSSLPCIVLSSLFIINSTVSLFNAHNSNDAVGTALQLQLLSMAFIFLFYSLLPYILPHPSPLSDLVAAFAFAEEFLLFHLQRKDPTGVENRYYDLLLVPIGICLFCTLLHLKSPTSSLPKLGRAIGLILHGTWFLQMGLSLFSSWVASGCSSHQVSRGNYTMRCKGHPEYHRARAIATLQFNCHLALMVLLFVVIFSVAGGGTDDSSNMYAPIGAELKPFDNSANFSLDSEDDEEEEVKATSHKPIIVERGADGNASHPLT
ncbi:hypothetical protein RJT34_16155 [Clitoria ternatea]|uniref:Uncharacterized protein n=1 Tax=Clitoria ternatea TaxID=43366 RepID=A0AAN9J6P1_CLITE